MKIGHILTVLLVAVLGLAAAAVFLYLKQDRTK